MKSLFRKLAATFALVCLGSAASTASADVLNFDDLVGGPQFFTSPYQGYTFGDTGSNPPVTGGGNWFWSDKAPPSTYLSPFTSVSTEATYLANGSPSTIEKESQKISSLTPFVLNGAWFTGLDDNISVTFCLYLGGIQVGAGSTAVLNLGLIPGLNDSTPYQFLASGYSGLIDAFTVHGLQGYFAMDGVAINIPEPAGYALVLIALGGLGLSKRRKND